MKIQPLSLIPVCRSLKKQRYGMLLLLCLLCTYAAADNYMPTLSVSAFRSTTTIGERLTDSKPNLGNTTFRIFTTSETEQSSLVSAFQSTSILLSSASASSGSTAVGGSSKSSGSSSRVSIPALPASGIVPSPAQMANTLASTYGNIPNPGDDIKPTNPENGAPVGEALLPLLLLAALYTIRLSKKLRTSELF